MPRYELRVTPDFQGSPPQGNAVLFDKEAGVEFEIIIDALMDAILIDQLPAQPDWVLACEIRELPSPTCQDWSTFLLIHVWNGSAIRLGDYYDFNPKGDRVASGSFHTPNVQIYDLLTGAGLVISPQTISLNKSTLYGGELAFSPDGQFLLIQEHFSSGANETPQLVLIDLDRQASLVIPVSYAGPEGPPYPPQWLPNSRSFLVQGIWGERFGIWEMSIEGEERNHWPVGIYPTLISKTHFAYFNEYDETDQFGWHLINFSTGQSVANLPFGRPWEPPQLSSDLSQAVVSMWEDGVHQHILVDLESGQQVKLDLGGDRLIGWE